MKSIKTLLLFIATLVFVSCNPKNQAIESGRNNLQIERIFEVRISFDSTCDQSLLGEIKLLSTGESLPHISTERYYDTINKSHNYMWDSLSSGDYSLKINSIFLFEKDIQLEISSDTVINIPNPFELKEVSLIDLNQLENADTIHFAYKSRGCFHDYWEKSILIRNKVHDNYLLKVLSNSIMIDGKYIDTTFIVPSSITKDIFSVQKDSKLLVEKQLASGTFYGSTTKQWFFLLINSQLSIFCDDVLKEWVNYENFKKKYSIKTKN